MKKQGKVKTIPVKELTKGMQVLINGDDAIFIVLEIDNIAEQVRVTCKESGNLIIDISELRMLVVEYEIYNREGLIDDDWKIQQLPLKYSQWQSAIDNGEVDSDKVVEFEIINDLNVGKSYISYAKIIPQKKKLYTEEELMIYSWYAVQWASKLQYKEPNKVIHKSDMEEYLKSEIY